MTDVLFIAGFEAFYNAADLVQAGWAGTGTENTNWGISSSYARTGTRSLHTYDRNIFITKTFDWAKQTVSFTYSIYCNNQTTAFNSAYYQFSFLDPVGEPQVTFTFNTDGSIRTYRGINTSFLGATASGVIVPDQWISISYKVYIHDTAGTVDITKNGVSVLSLSSIDTKHSGTYSTVGGFKIGSFNDNIHGYYDDMYATDGDPLGDLEITTKRSDGAGSNTDFTPSAGNNYENVDETYPDDDTTYNYSTSVGDKDSYAMENVSGNKTIYAVQNSVVARKTDSGTRTIKVLSRLNGTDYLGSEEGLGETYNYFSKLYNLNPDDSAVFEDADINGMEVGLQVAA